MNLFIFYYLQLLYTIISLKMEHSDYSEWFVFGDPESTDIDVACVVPYESSYNITNKSQILSKEAKEKLKKELEEFGYDITKNIDETLVYIRDTVMNVLTVTTFEIDKIIFETYKYHKQKYVLPNIIVRPVNIKEKYDAIFVFYRVMKDLLCVKDKIPKVKKIDFYENNLHEIIDYDKCEDIEWKNAMKILIVRYCQFIATKIEDENYNKYKKRDLAYLVAKKLGLDQDDILYFLFRGTIGTLNKNLVDIFHKYVKNNNN